MRVLDEHVHMLPEDNNKEFMFGVYIYVCVWRLCKLTKFLHDIYNTEYTFVFVIKLEIIDYALLSYQLCFIILSRDIKNIICLCIKRIVLQSQV